MLDAQKACNFLTVLNTKTQQEPTSVDKILSAFRCLCFLQKQQKNQKLMNEHYCFSS